MSRNLHKVRLETGDGITRIFLDDQEIKGCYHAEFKWDVKEPPVLDLQILATDIQIDMDKVEVNHYDHRSE